MHEKALLKAAWSARERAHAPYSKFQVGAALLTRSGAVHSGCNVENASYPCGSCAETTAIVKAVSEGDLRPGDLMAILVATDTAKPTTPCGRCRQVMEEFGSPTTKVFLSTHPERVDQSWELAAMLPNSFSRNQLRDDPA